VSRFHAYGAGLAVIALILALLLRQNVLEPAAPQPSRPQRGGEADWPQPPRPQRGGEPGVEVFVESNDDKRLAFVVPAAYFPNGVPPQSARQHTVNLRAAFPSLQPWNASDGPWHVAFGNDEEGSQPARAKPLAVTVAPQRVSADTDVRRYAWMKQRYVLPAPAAFGLEHFLTPPCPADLDKKDWKARARCSTREEEVFMNTPTAEGGFAVILCSGGRCSGVQAYRGFETYYAFRRDDLVEWREYRAASLNLLNTFAARR